MFRFNKPFSREYRKKYHWKKYHFPCQTGTVTLCFKYVFLHASVTTSLQQGFFFFYLKCQSSSSVVIFQEILGALQIVNPDGIFLMMWSIFYAVELLTVWFTVIFPLTRNVNITSSKWDFLLDANVVWFPGALGCGGDWWLSRWLCTVTSAVTWWLHQLWVRHSWLSGQV